MITQESKMNARYVHILGIWNAALSIFQGVLYDLIFPFINY
jgi:hypothetical protein